MSFESSFTKAESALEKGKVSLATSLFRSARQAFESQGRPTLSADLSRRYVRFTQHLVSDALGNFDAWMGSGTYSTEKLTAMLDDYVELFEEVKDVYFSSSKKDEIEEQIAELRKKIHKFDVSNQRMTNTDDLDEVRELQQSVGFYRSEISNVASSGQKFDCRKPIAGRIPLEEVVGLVKKLAKIIPNQTTTLAESHAVARLHSEIENARVLIEQFLLLISEIDEEKYQSWMQSQDIQSLLSAEARISSIDVGAIPSEQEADAKIVDIGNIQQQVGDEKNRLIRSGLHLPPNELGVSDDRVDVLFSKQSQLLEKISDTIAIKKGELEKRKNSLIEERKKQESVDSQLAEIRRKMQLFENIPLESFPAMSLQEDPLKTHIDSVRALADRLRQHVTESQYKEFLAEVLFHDYRITKKMLQSTMIRAEIGSDKYKELSKLTGSGKIVIGTRILGRLDFVVEDLRSGGYPGISGALLSELERDAKRVKKEFDLGSNVFMSEQSVDSTIWWNGVSDKGAARGIPHGLTHYFDVTGKVIDSVISSSEEPSQHPLLRINGEYQLNPEIPISKTVEKSRFDDPSQTEQITFTATLYGEIMRWLDKLYAGKVPGYESFYQKMHFQAPEIPGIISSLMNQDFVSRGVQLVVKPEQVKRAYYLHTLFLNHSMLLKSSPQLSDGAYYANGFLEYSLKEGKSGVASYPFLRFLLFFGKFDMRKYDPDVPDDHRVSTEGVNSEGKNYIFEQIGVVDDITYEFPKASTLMEKLAYATTAIKKKSKGSESIRKKIISALLHEGRDNFLFMANLPWRAIDRSPFGTYPIMPTPLQFMVFKDNAATYPTRYNGEKRVIRWGSADGDSVGSPVTAADFVTTDGEILYELIPWEDVVDATDLKSWYNNGKNINGMLELFKSESVDISNVVEIAKDKKTAKYGAYFIPALGIEAAIGRFNVEKVFDEFIQIYILGQAIFLLNSGKHLSEIEESISKLTSVLGSEAVQALTTVIRAGFGDKEVLDEYMSILQEQFDALLKLQQ